MKTKRLTAASLCALFFYAIAFLYYKDSKDSQKLPSDLVNGRKVLANIAAKARAKVHIVNAETEASSNDSLQATVQYLLANFSKLLESSRYFNSDQLQAEIFEQFDRNPQNLELLQRALQSRVEAEMLFGTKHAEARVYAIHYLHYLRKKGNDKPIEQSLAHLASDPTEVEARKHDKGRIEDFKDLIYFYIEGTSGDLLVSRLHELADEINYTQMPAEARTLVEHVFSEYLGPKYASAKVFHKLRTQVLE